MYSHVTVMQLHLQTPNFKSIQTLKSIKYLFDSIAACNINISVFFLPEATENV